MALVVENPGAFATIQDHGRPGFRQWGVPPAGAFDRESHDLANALLGNDPSAATVELTLFGGTYRADSELAIALTGAPLSATVASDGRTIRIPQTLTLRAGDRLVIGGSPLGARAYLAVRGGWKTTEILGSRSSETPLKANDRLQAVTSRTSILRLREAAWPDPEDGPIRVVDGPDLPEDAIRADRVYRVAPQSDRMGLRLDGEVPTVMADPDRTSMPVCFGTVQVAGDRLIVLGPAGGTMGGYPQIAQVISADLDRIAQARPGAALRFLRIGIDEARRIDAEDRSRRAALRLLVSCRAD